MQHHVNVKPVRLRGRHDLLGVDSVRVIGYRASCSCGERGPVRATVRHAREWIGEHAAVIADQLAHPAGQSPTTP